MWSGVVFVLLVGVPACQKSVYSAYYYDTDNEDDYIDFHDSYDEDVVSVPETTTTLEARTRKKNGVKKHGDIRDIRTLNPAEIHDVKDVIKEIFYGHQKYSLSTRKKNLGRSYTDVYDYVDRNVAQKAHATFFINKNANEMGQKWKPVRSFVDRKWTSTSAVQRRPTMAVQHWRPNYVAQETLNTGRTDENDEKVSPIVLVRTPSSTTTEQLWSPSTADELSNPPLSSTEDLMTDDDDSLETLQSLLTTGEVTDVTYTTTEATASTTDADPPTTDSDILKADVQRLITLSDSMDSDDLELERQSLLTTGEVTDVTYTTTDATASTTDADPPTTDRYILKADVQRLFTLIDSMDSDDLKFKRQGLHPTTAAASQTAIPNPFREGTTTTSLSTTTTTTTTTTKPAPHNNEGESLILKAKTLSAENETASARAADVVNATTITIPTQTKVITARSPKVDINAIIAIIANLTYDYDWNLTEQFNETLIKYGVPTCQTETTLTTTTTTQSPYDFRNTSIVAKCFVCGLKTMQIPRNAHCSDAFGGDFLPMVPVDPGARRHIASFRKYCRYMDVHNFVENPSEPRSIYGRFTGGCGVRWTDLTGVYTQRTCRNRFRPLMGRHFASKRMAKLELALINVENGCIISPMATLLPLSRGISLYARFHACVCTGSWCNKAVRIQQWKLYLTILWYWLTNIL